MNIQVISALHVTATEKKHIKKLLETGHTQAKINTKYYCIQKGVPIKNGYQYTIVINTPQRSERTNEIEYKRQTIEIIVKKYFNGAGSAIFGGLAPKKSKQMNKQQYEQKAKALFKKYNVFETPAGYEYNSTILGQFKINTTYTPQIKSAFFAIILRDSAKRIDFIENFWAMDRTCKYNRFSDNPEFMLNEVEQFLDCLKWLENQNNSTN